MSAAVVAATVAVAKSSPGGLVFRQLYDPPSSTYTYLLGCPDTREALLIDPVLEQAARDLKLAQELGASSMPDSWQRFRPTLLAPPSQGLR